MRETRSLVVECECSVYTLSAPKHLIQVKRVDFAVHQCLIIVSQTVETVLRGNDFPPFCADKHL